MRALAYARSEQVLFLDKNSTYVKLKKKKSQHFVYK